MRSRVIMALLFEAPIFLSGGGSLKKLHLLGEDDFVDLAEQVKIKKLQL